jgi:hemerythrin-like domain-containing protein
MSRLHTTAPAPAPDVTPGLDRSLPAIVIHTALRRELRLAAPLVRRVADGDTGRAEVVGDHLRIVLDVLHHHHENEDLLAWPPMRARATPEEADLVAVMEDQHGQLEPLLDRIGAVLPRWTATAGRPEREQLAVGLDELYVTLVAHLDLEERAALPLAERLLTEEEWIAIGEHGEKGAEGPHKLLVLGMLVYEGDPAVVSSMLAAAPRPVRALLPRVALRAYRRHARKVHGTPTP